MVELSHRDRTIRVKIVYYGPPVGGKTTNLQVLHLHAIGSRKGEMISINSAQDRTILFDLLPIKTMGFRGFDLRLQLLAVPGQAMYAATRRLVLKGADALVFVANSAVDRWEENIQSYREMTQNLLTHQLDASTLPLVLQYNKRDLPEVTEIELMDRALNARKVDSIPAVAVVGEGVLETFAAILQRTIQDLTKRYNILEGQRGPSAWQWTQQTIQSVFGRTSLTNDPSALPKDPAPPLLRTTPVPGAPTPLPSRPPSPASAATPPPPREQRRTVRVTLPEEAVRRAGSGPDARANETLVESYAEATTQLGNALSDLRDDRDTARRRLEDIQQVLSAAQDILSGRPLDETLRAVLARMAAAAGAAQASFLLPQPDTSFRCEAVLGLAEDPLVKAPDALRFLSEKDEAAPRLHASGEAPALAAALEAGPFASVLTVNVRTPRGLQGLAALYYDLDAAAPPADLFPHLGQLSRALSASLELAATLDTVRSAERALELALAGTASLKGLDEVVTSLIDLRDRLGTMRRRPDAPSWFVDEFADLVPSLAGALAAARALVAFGKGQIQHEAVAVPELISGLNATDAVVLVAPGADTVYGDPVLLHLGLLALLDQARALGGSNAPAIELLATAEDKSFRVRVSFGGGLRGPSGSSPATAAPTGLGLSLVRRIAELHGGSLGIETAADGRSVFTLSIPSPS
jgi:hypothetical protein